MKRLSVPAKVGVSIGVGIGLGIGLINLTANSSSNASPPSSKVVAPIMEQQTPNLTTPDSTIQHFTSEKDVRNGINIAAQHPTISEQSNKQVTPTSAVAVASTVPNDAIAHTLTQTIPGVSTCPYAQATPSDASLNNHRYVYHSADLNGDRQDEVIVQIIGPMTCGTGGCSTLILQPSANQDGVNDSAYDVVTQMSLTNFPMVVSDRTSSGWSNLLVMVSGGGAEAGYRQLKFDGQSYPTNPSLEPFVTADVAESAGTKVVITEDAGAIAPVIAAPGCDS